MCMQDARNYAPSVLGDDMDSATECVKFKEKNKNWKKKVRKLRKVKI